MKKYEYKYTAGREPLSEERLNTLGQNGWLLVGYTTTVQGEYFLHYYIFTREKEETPAKSFTTPTSLDPDEYPF